MYPLSSFKNDHLMTDLFYVDIIYVTLKDFFSHITIIIIISLHTHLCVFVVKINYSKCQDTEAT